MMRRGMRWCRARHLPSLRVTPRAAREGRITTAWERAGVLWERARCRKLLGHIRRGLLDRFSSSDGWSLTTLGAGADIGVAAEYSECPSGKKGGDLGRFPRGKMAGPFQEVAFNTPRGVLSAPFKSTTKEVMHCVHDQLGLELKLQVRMFFPRWSRLEVKIRRRGLKTSCSSSVLAPGVCFSARAVVGAVRDSCMGQQHEPVRRSSSPQ